MDQCFKSLVWIHTARVATIAWLAFIHNAVGTVVHTSHTNTNRYRLWGLAVVSTWLWLVHFITYYVQPFLRSWVWTHMVRANTSDMGCIHIYDGLQTIIHATHPPKKVLVTWGSSGLDNVRGDFITWLIACNSASYHCYGHTMHLIHALLYTTVFEIIGMAIPGKGKHLLHCLY